MIRIYNETDISAVLDIWLQASIKAHDFVAPEFWESQVESMRNIYIPASKTFIFESDSKIIGFYSLFENTLAAIFVSPESQGKGTGKQLMNHAKSQCTKLKLSVYKENETTVQFYLSQGFTIVSEQADQHTGHQEYSMNLNT